MPWKADPDKKASALCPQCGASFSYYKCAPKEYCSRACFGASKRATTACPTCGKEFWFHKSWPRIYCSNVCKGTAHITNIKSFSATGFDAACEACGATFHTSPAATRGRFCSRTCWGEWQSEHVRGATHPKWKYGYPYGSSWPAARDAARARDVVCRDCGKTAADNGRALDVHHIKPFHTFGLKNHGAANALDNLMALCTACHIEREWSTNWIMAGKKPFGHRHTPAVAHEA